jgi:predicted hydrocarbon binding protein
MAGIFTQFSDQKSYVYEEADRFIYVIERCPVCWGRRTDRPVCYAAIGLLQEGLRWVSGGKEFRVEQISCIAMGDPNCSFAIYKEPIG